MRKTYLLLAAGLFAAGSLLAPADATAQDDLLKRLAGVEQRLWQGWAEADATPLRHHATADYITIGDWGMVIGRDANIEMAAVSDCDVKSYELDDWQLHRLSDKTAILTYEAEQDGECDGMKIAEDVLVSAVYVMDGGEWKAASYHETPVTDGEEDDDGDEEDDDGTAYDGR